MAENSGIAWTTHTFNPWIGCTKVGPGCDHCYAEAWNVRFSSDGLAPNWGPGAPRRRTTAQNWSKVRKWDRDAGASGRRPWVFCASLADVFDNEASELDRKDLWQLVRETKNLRYQFVTKRIGNASKMMPRDWEDNFRHCGIIATTVTQEECDRDLPKLQRLKYNFGVAWVGLSIEPQIERVMPKDPEGLDWIITGGESEQRGAKARPYDLQWARDLIELGKSCGAKIFVKQIGSNPVGMKSEAYNDDDTIISDRAGSDPSEWPLDIRVREFPL